MLLSDSNKQVLSKWLDPKLLSISKADSKLLKDYLLEYLYSPNCTLPNATNEQFSQDLVDLLNGIVDDIPDFANNLYNFLLELQKNESTEENAVKIENIPSSISTNEQVKDEFKQFGEIENCAIITGNDSNIAVVFYKDKESVTKCINSVIPFYNNRFVSVSAVGGNKKTEVDHSKEIQDLENAAKQVNEVVAQMQNSVPVPQQEVETAPLQEEKSTKPEIKVLPLEVTLPEGTTIPNTTAQVAHKSLETDENAVEPERQDFNKLPVNELESKKNFNSPSNNEIQTKGSQDRLPINETHSPEALSPVIHNGTQGKENFEESPILQRRSSTSANDEVEEAEGWNSSYEKEEDKSRGFQQSSNNEFNRQEHIPMRKSVSDEGRENTAKNSNNNNYLKRKISNEESSSSFYDKNTQWNELPLASRVRIVDSDRNGIDNRRDRDGPEPKNGIWDSLPLESRISKTDSPKLFTSHDEVVLQQVRILIKVKTKQLADFKILVNKLEHQIRKTMNEYDESPHKLRQLNNLYYDLIDHERIQQLSPNILYRLQDKLATLIKNERIENRSSNNGKKPRI